jgi:hypothetical protein
MLVEMAVHGFVIVAMVDWQRRGTVKEGAGFGEDEHGWVFW